MWGNICDDMCDNMWDTILDDIYDNMCVNIFDDSAVLLITHLTKFERNDVIEAACCLSYECTCGCSCTHVLSGEVVEMVSVDSPYVAHRRAVMRTSQCYTLCDALALMWRKRIAN